MRWLHLNVLLIFFFCVLECLYKNPFTRELPVFILPEVSLSASIVRDDVSIFGDITDVRADYVQTEHNFSAFHDMDFEDKNQLLLEIAEEEVMGGRELVKRQPIWQYRELKDRVDKAVVWARKIMKPIKIR